jgi:raffinose/stachyose/melibiose transport system substrate-binding protein
MPYSSRQPTHGSRHAVRHHSQTLTYVKDNRTVPFMDQLWPNAKVQQTMLSGLQEIFSNQSTPQKVLAAMDQDYKSGS